MNLSEGKVTEIADRRELAERDNDGVHVLLLWHPGADAVSISVHDSRAGRQFELVVDGRDALDAFYHPFAYAA